MHVLTTSQDEQRRRAAGPNMEQKVAAIECIIRSCSSRDGDQQHGSHQDACGQSGDGAVMQMEISRLALTDIQYANDVQERGRSMYAGLLTDGSETSTYSLAVSVVEIDDGSRGGSTGGREATAGALMEIWGG